VFGMVMDMTMLWYRLSTVNTGTLLWESKPYCCCTKNITYCRSTVYWWSWKRWRVSEEPPQTTTANTDQVFESW